MDNAQAKNIISDTFENPFNKERFTYFIKNLLNFIDETKSFSVNSEYVKDMFKSVIKSYERIATYTDPDDKKIDIIIVNLQKNHSLDYARTTQRNFAGAYLKGRGEKDAGLFAFVSPDKKDWRFSLVTIDYEFKETEKGMQAKASFTPAKRYSFLMGVNEASHTAQSRLIKILANDKSNPAFSDLEEAFNIEKVTEEFFLQYRKLFLQVKEALDKIAEQNPNIKAEFDKKNVDTVNFAKKLLGQIIFLYFLQKKGWFGVERGKEWGTGSKRFLRELFDKKHENYNYDNFFDDILEPLFYEAIRIDRSHEDHYYSRFNCKIPFLNGGLFDPICNYDWVNTAINLPNSLFSNKNKDGILDIFDLYNFTVQEDQPLEKEVAIDPELLGKAYEKFNAIRQDNFYEFQQALKSGKKGDENKFNKKFGVYYTPREIVHYMCRQSLINYLHAEAGKEKLNPPLEKKDIQTLIEKGEFILENEAIAVEKEEKIKSGEQKTASYKSELSQALCDNAQTIDNFLQNIKVCDPAVGSGAFPVGMMNEIVIARKVLGKIIKNSDISDYNLKRQCIERSLYGADIDSGAVEIAKLRLWLSLIVDEQDIKNIKPLPNLDYKIVCGNSLTGLTQDLFNQKLFEELEQLKNKLFNETHPVKKEKYKNKINNLIRQISGGYKEFDFKLYFSEVFREKKGFDIVIGNPPYIKEYVNKSAFDNIRNLPCYQGKMDIWYLFACKGIDIVNKLGLITLIAQNNWVTSFGASKMRNKVISESQILHMIDFGDFKIFEAGIQTMIMIFRKNSDSDNYTFDYRRLIGKNSESNDVNLILEKKNSPKAEYLTPKINRSLFIGKTLTFANSNVEQILQKILSASNFKLYGKEAAQGIVAPQDFINKKSLKILKNDYKINQGIFVLSNKEKLKIPFNSKELDIIKPSYTTKELFRWHANPSNKEWVIYTASGFKNKKKIEAYPNIKKHLDQFEKVITSDNKPYGLHRARNEDFFKGEKIIATRKCATPSFTYTDFDAYVSATFYVIKTERVNQKYLTAVLNSELIAFWLKHKGKKQGSNFQIDKEPILALPLLKSDQTEQNIIVNIVNKILAITKDSDYLENPVKQQQVKEYEKKIDNMVYKLYGLAKEEIKIIELKGK